jgi:hypothetical protein
MYVENYSVFEQDYAEYTVQIRCSPDILLQILAFKGVAQNEDGPFLQISDWDNLPPQVLEEIRQALFISYSQFLNGKKDPEKDGSYILKSLVAAVKVKGGIISMHSHEDRRKHATNRRRTVLI